MLAAKDVFGMADNPFLDYLEEAIAPTIDEDCSETRNFYEFPENFDEFLPMCRIRSGVKIIPFLPYPYQIKLLQILKGHQMVMILKDRQTGITETFAAFLLYDMLMNSAFLGALLSITQDKSSDVSDRLKLMASAMRELTWVSDSKKEKNIENAGACDFLPSTDNAVRGLNSVATLIYDECGFVENFEEIYGAGSSAQEMVEDADRTTVLNTTVPPEGELSIFWSMFDANNGAVNAREMVEVAKSGNSNCEIPGFCFWVDVDGCAKVIISHKAHPKYSQDPDYIENVMRRRKIPRSMAEREHNLGIECAQGSLFSSEALTQSAIGAWSEPQSGRRYAAMTDPNFGGGDNWVTQVWDITEIPFSLVAEYAECDRSTEYSRGKALALGDKYDVLYHAVESNSGGKVVIENMQRDRPGLNIVLTNTTRSSKIENTDRIALAVDQQEVIFPADWLGINEAKRFSQKDRCATGSAKDDRIMSWAAGWAHLEEYAMAQSMSVHHGSMRRG